MRATRFSEIHEWNKSLTALTRDRQCPHPGFFKPYHFVTLALVLKGAGVGTLNLPDDVVSYAARMRLWEAIGLSSPVVVQGNPGSTRIHELTRLVDLNAVENVSEALAAFVTKNVGKPCTYDTEQSLYVMLTELLGNCHHHARSDDNLHGLVCAQSWYNGSRAQFAIADSGIGVRKSLEENPDLTKRLSEDNSCELALRLGISSKLNRGHAGYGLALAKDLTLQSRDAMLVVQSYNEAVVVQNGKVTTFEKLDDGFDGTLVVFEWDTKSPLDVTSVYANWPKSKDEGDDYF
jgi:hypothetical protein